MKDRYPRTAAEFAEAGRLVVLRCEACGHRRALDPQLVIFTFDADFDLYDGFAELRAQLYCAACGAGRPAIHFYNTREKHFEPVSFEEALNAHVEFSAFAAARDAEDPAPPRKHRRIRKFGRR